MILLSLRQAIFKRVEGRSNEELVQIIQDSIDAEEKVLPGLGVLFEMIWKNSDTALREKMVEVLGANLPAGPPDEEDKDDRKA